MPLRPWLASFGLGLLVLATAIRGQEIGVPRGPVTLLEQRRMLLPKISPDGRWLVYLTYAPDAELPTAHVRAFGTEEPSRALVESVLEETDIAWNRSGDLIALLRLVDDRVTLEVLRMNSERLLSATLPEGEIVGGLGWLTDDWHLAVGCERSVLIVDTGSGEVIRHLPIVDEEFSPDLSKFSISGENRIAFSAVAAGEPHQRIWIAKIDSPDMKPAPVTEGPADVSPLWIDDSTIVFSRGDEAAGFDVHHLWRVDVDSGKEEKISDGNVHDNLPSWSTTERIVVFSRLPLSSPDMPELPAESGDDKAVTFSGILEQIERAAREVYFNVRVAYMRLD